MHSRFTFFTQLAFTLFLLAFLFVPMGLFVCCFSLMGWTDRLPLTP